MSEIQRAELQARARATMNQRIIMDVGALGSKAVTAEAFLPPEGGWTEEAFRAVVLGHLDDVARGQAARSNPLETMIVDGAHLGDPSKFRKNVTLMFQGGRDIRPVMIMLWNEANSRVPNTIWKWRVSSHSPGQQALLIKAVNSGGPVNLIPGDRVYLVPHRFTGTGDDPTYTNIKFVQNRSVGAAAKAFSKGKRIRSLRKGFYALTSAAMRRKAVGLGVHITAIHSLRHAHGLGRKLPPGVNIGDRTKKTGGMYQGAWGFKIQMKLGK